MLYYLIAGALGAGVTFLLTRRYWRNITEAAHTAETDAKLLVDRAKNEYKNLKLGLAHKLDEILGEK